MTDEIIVKLVGEQNDETEDDDEDYTETTKKKMTHVEDLNLPNLPFYPLFHITLDNRNSTLFAVHGRSYERISAGNTQKVFGS